ncbi:hypothetical protein MD484_g91, partial [Candolleomyces efflorescens]
MSDEEYYDNLPDAFGDVAGVDWAAILAGPAAGPSGRTSPADQVALNGARSRSSSYFNENDDDYLDPGVLAEIDEIERQATQSNTSALPSVSRTRANAPSESHIINATSCDWTHLNL